MARTFQVEVFCPTHNRALTPVKAPKQPFGKQWAIYNLTDLECEAGKLTCEDNWQAKVNGQKAL